MTQLNPTLSAYVYREDRDGQSALFHGLTNKKAYLPTAELDALLEGQGDGESLETLQGNGFLFSSEEDKKAIDEMCPSLGEINISNIVLLVANDCNYACKYCQIEENMTVEQKKHFMTRDMAEKAFDFYLANTTDDRKKTISITGGEPLLNWEITRYLIERASTLKNARVVVFTNGSLVTEEMATFFAEHKVLMLVSLDGAAKHHDKVRVFKGGKGTHEASLKGYQMLKDAGCSVGISAVTGTHNMDDIDGLMDYFSELSPPSIGLNFGHHLIDKPNPTALDMKVFAKILSTVYERMRSQGIFLENISRFITPFVLEKPRVNECQAQGRGITIDSRGKIGVCKSLLVSDHISFDLDEMPEDISEVEVFQQWAKRSPLTMSECEECQFLSICGGGCTYDAFAVNSGDITKIDPGLCDYTKAIISFLLWDYYDHNSDSFEGTVHIPTVDQLDHFYLGGYDFKTELQRSVGHERDR